MAPVMVPNTTSKEGPMIGRKLCSLLAASVLALGATAAPAFAWFEEEGKPKHGKCNSGNGNGSDVITFTAGEHCYGGDPGNSFNAGNKGGDEIPTSGGVSNPGGNNVP
jgi:hypothetical protein